MWHGDCASVPWNLRRRAKRKRDENAETDRSRCHRRSHARGLRRFGGGGEGRNRRPLREHPRQVLRQRRDSLGLRLPRHFANGSGARLARGLRLAHSIATDELPLDLSLGVWGSNVDFADGDNASVELDYYGSVGTVYRDIGLTANFIYYDYPGADDDLNDEFDEFGPSISYNFGLATVEAAFAYSPDFFGAVGKAYYYSADVTVPLPYEFVLVGHVGYQDYERSTNNEYAEWKIALSREVLGFDLSAAYTDTDLEKSECAGTDGCDTRAVFTASRSF